MLSRGGGDRETGDPATSWMASQPASRQATTVVCVFLCDFESVTVVIVSYENKNGIDQKPKRYS